MKKFVLLILLILSAYGIFAQCPLHVTLYSTGSLHSKGSCLGDRLTVSPAGSLMQIAWINGNSTDSTARATNPALSITTVAGGHGVGSGADQFNEPEGIFVDAQGNLYVADYFNSRVQKWAPGAVTGITVAGGNGMGYAPSQLSYPTTIFIDGSGNLYISDIGNGRVQKWAPGAGSGITVVGNILIGNQYNAPLGITVDGSGNVYESNLVANWVIKTPAGSDSNTIGTIVAGDPAGIGGSGAAFLGQPRGICLDAIGNLYIADFNNHRIQKWAPGAASGITVAGGNGKGSAANQVSCPMFVFVDQHDDLFVSDFCNDRVQEWTPGATSGITVAGVNGPGSGYDQFNGPEGVYVDIAGNLFVSDEGSNSVLKYSHYFYIDSTYVPTSPGTYTAVVTDKSGCVVTTNAIIINPDIPDSIHIVSSASQVCPDSLLTFQATSFNAGTAPLYQWLVDGKAAETDSPNFSNSSWQAGDTVNCILTNTTACALPAISNTIAITVKQQPTVYAGDDTVIAPGASLRLNPSITGTIASYQWMPVAGLDNPSIADPIAAPVITTTYQLTVTAEDGCSASGLTTVTVYRSLSMPGAFTPNGDGKNDVFRIPPSAPQKIIYFSVYNRSGARIFTTTNSGIGWDGSFHHQQQPPGTYVWEIGYYDLLTGKSRKENGTVVLVR